MVRKAWKDNANLLWGTESFTIITKLDNQDGKILEATMTNTLDLPNLQTFTMEMPFKILRKLTLTLIASPH